MTLLADEASRVAGAADRSRFLRALALEEGFDRAGIATLQRSEYGAAFSGWLERGDHAGMKYLERRPERRLLPSLVMEGARSAVCVAQHYPGSSPQAADSDLWCGVARYARGEDYHDFMLEGLRRLGDRVEAAFPGCRTRSYVDTGPILERELAERAGLGKIGKNTMLLHPTGSWFMLGELLTTLELEPDEPLSDLCGRCTRCLQACPTGALVEPYRLDAQLCISYRTIEHRGEIPEEWIGEASGWTFGCDICQEVCPWNAPRNPRQPEIDDERWATPAERADLSLADLLGLDHAAYVRTFRGSALKRAKLEGLQRNAVSVLAEPSRHADLELLINALRNVALAVRAATATALIGMARLDHGKTREHSQNVAADAIKHHLEAESDPGIRSRILVFLNSCRAPSSTGNG